MTSSVEQAKRGRAEVHKISFFTGIMIGYLWYLSVQPCLDTYTGTLKAQGEDGCSWESIYRCELTTGSIVLEKAKEEKKNSLNLKLRATESIHAL